MRCVDATERLRTVQTSRSPGELVESLDDPSPEVVRAAIARLVDLEGPRAAEALRARLLDVDLSLVADVAGALRRIGDNEAAQLAIAALRHDGYSRRLAAVRATEESPSARSTKNVARSGSGPVRRRSMPRCLCQWNRYRSRTSSPVVTSPV